MEECGLMHQAADGDKCCDIDCYACRALYSINAQPVKDCPDFETPVDAGIKDALNPSHYKSHPSGVECIEITQHMGFLDGNAFKYLWRAGLKDDKVQDLKKAIWYIERLIEKEEK